MSVDDRPLTILLNPSAGGGRSKQALRTLEVELDRRRLPFRVVLTQSVDHACEEALLAAEAGELPVVMSGDGLIGQVGGALAGGDVPLGVVPCGRGNDLARVLGIPTDMEGAAEVLAAGHTREIDVGEVNGERFLCIASCGFDSECNNLANRVRLVKGNLVYAYSALRTLLFWRAARFTVVADGRRSRFTGYSVAIANSKAYGGGMFIAPDALLDDGAFDIILLAKVSKLRFLANLPKVFKGTHVDNEEVTVLRAAHVEISASRPFEIYADGDHIADLPADLRVLERALRIVAPPQAEE
jgi:YegS/Rv2252/BmrU family lipid kinase